MPRRSHESLGDYISSACFGGVAFLSLLNGLEAFYSGNILRAISIWFVCFLSRFATKDFCSSYFATKLFLLIFNPTGHFW